MKTLKKAFYFPLLFLFLLFNLSTLASAANIAFSNVQIDGKDSITINGSILQIGNQLLCKTTADFAACQDPLTTGNTQNNYHLQYRARIDSNVTHSNTMAKLVMEAGDEVVLARLYWSARAANSTDAESATARNIRIKGPASTTYDLITAPVEKHGSDSYDYGASADVTDYIKANGAGDYYVGDILTQSGGYGIYASWQLVVVVTNPARSLKNIAIYDGFDSIFWDTITVDATGFITPTGTDPFDANLFVYAGETDDGYGDNTEILDGTGAWIPLVDGQNDPNDVMNASVSSPDYTGGYRDLEPNMANPNYRNVLGVDIDKLVINDKLNTSKQTLSNSQTATQIKLTSTGDLYSLNMFAFETEVFVPEFCYDYAYKQQGKYFTEKNDGSSDPRLVGDVVNGEDIEVTIYIKSMVDATIQIQDMEIDVSDINKTQADLDTSSVLLAKVGYLVPVTPTYSTSTIGDEDYINDVDIGILDQNDYFYLYYTLNPKTTDLDMPITVEASYNLVLDSTSVAYHLRLSQDIPLCDGGSYDYNPYSGVFNVVHNDYYNSSTKYYNLPTQVSSRAGNFKVISTSEDDHDLLEPKSTIVAVELIDAAAFQTTDASCREFESAISEKIWVIFDDNVSEVMFDKDGLESFIGLNNTITTAAEFYAQARENTAFRVSYNEVKDNNGSLIDHTLQTDGTYIINNFTQLVQDIGKCAQPVQYPLGASGNAGTATTVATACGNASATNSISPAFYQACMECLYGYNVKFVCSRDNFALRPEAFLLKLNDQNQTTSIPRLRLSDDVSGVVSPSTTRVQVAGGYQYKLEVNATNHLDNTATIGYTKVFEKSSVTDYSGFKWTPTGITSGCNDFNNSYNNFKIVDGQIDMNDSLNQVGEYTFLMKDTTWTSVDSNPEYMKHHTGSYYLDPTTNKDCDDTTSDTQPINTSQLNGCIISSNHDSSYINISGETLKYRDYNVTFHPYRFDLTGITPTVGLTHDDINASSFVYMSDMSVSPVDENMSYHLNGTIRAAGENNSSLSNFVENCYAKPLNIDLNISNLNFPVAYQYRFHSLAVDGSDINTHNADVSNSTNVINLAVADFPKDNNGSAETILNLNYNRTNNFEVNPEAVTFNNYNVDCTTVANCTFNADLVADKTSKGTEDLNGSISIKHYYGRTHAPRNRFVGATGNAFIYYEVYCNGTTVNGSQCNKDLLQNKFASKMTDDPRWFRNEAHIATSHGTAGTTTTITQKGTSNRVTTINVDDNTTGLTTASISYDETRGYPYKATMENNASRFLIYDKYDVANTKTLNEFEVEFMNSNSTWAGQSDTDTTTDDIGSKKTNRRSMW